MKRVISGLLSMVGLVPARRYQVLVDQVEQAKSAAHEWKAKAGQSMARVRELEADIKQQTRQAQKSELYLSKMRERREEVQSLRTRLAEAERELMVAREHLMAIEVKLDILEGAANVLDVRTRAAISRPHNETSARA
jgi:predicted RNase H-like nuclease (RuvC/YqgF family)